VSVNNRARRAAKKRKRDARERPSARGTGTAAAQDVVHDHPPGATSGTDTGHAAALLVVDAIGRLERGDGVAADLAARLLVPGALHGARPAAIVQAMRYDLTMATAAAGAAGWTPHDLGELVGRRLTADHLPVLAWLLADEVRRHPAQTVSARWRDEVAALGRAAEPAFDTVTGLALGLALAAVLGAVPPIPRLLPPPGRADALAEAQQRAGRDGPAAKVLARVRGLLAKAESTEYPEEAEALSTKAQELISRYSLDAMLHTSAREPASGPAPIVSRRLWIDAPYVGAKANLIHQVAVANRCSSVVAERLGFTTVVGTMADLDVVELLSTSLMVQADAAMLAAGKQVDHYGGSRTASYRRSFLLAYATRIGQRLAEVTDAAVASATEADRSGALVPLLRGQEERVDATVTQLFPHTVRKRASVGNMKGWAEGTAAADGARIDVRRPIAR
jgi:hypothetical protein